MMQRLRKLIYFLKRGIHNRPGLYRIVYFLVTLNVDYVKQCLSPGQYASSFGGMWTDRKNFDSVRHQKLAAHAAQPLKNQVEHWRDQGYVTFNNAISTNVVDELVDYIDGLNRKPTEGLLVTGSAYNEPQPYRPEIIKPHDSIRLVDLYFHNETARQILFAEPIMHFLQTVFDAQPILTQSLSFKFGSEQSVHQDTAYVIMNAPIKLAAIWVALEDVQPGSGELCYYPGSHLWGDFLFSGRFKHFDMERDGPQQQTEWLNWLHAQAEQRGVALQTFLPKKGDVFVWHAGLAHGGVKITNPEQTRLSLVGHYCPAGVRPLYHYYKPAQRKFYAYGDYSYSSAYYKR